MCLRDGRHELVINICHGDRAVDSFHTVQQEKRLENRAHGLREKTRELWCKKRDQKSTAALILVVDTAPNVYEKGAGLVQPKVHLCMRLVQPDQKGGRY